MSIEEMSYPRPEGALDESVRILQQDEGEQSEETAATTEFRQKFFDEIIVRNMLGLDAQKVTFRYRKKICEVSLNSGVLHIIEDQVSKSVDTDDKLLANTNADNWLLNRDTWLSEALKNAQTPNVLPQAIESKIRKRIALPIEPWLLVLLNEYSTTHEPTQRGWRMQAEENPIVEEQSAEEKISSES